MVRAFLSRALPRSTVRVGLPTRWTWPTTVSRAATTRSAAGGRYRQAVRVDTRQMLGANDVRGHQDGPSDDVSKLADIPRPRTAQEQFGCLLRYRANGPPEFHARFGQKAVRQR